MLSQDSRIDFEKDASGVMESIRFWGNSFVCDIWAFLRDRSIDAYADLLKHYCD